MELDETELLREQVRIQAETIAQLQYDLSRQKAIVAVLVKEDKPVENIPTEQLAS